MAHEENATIQGESQHDRHEDSGQSQSSSTTKKSNRGFASMDRSKQREIASKGGRAAHEKGTAHQFTTDEAREAGRKGGGTVSQDRQHMAEIGRIGGQARGRKQRAAAAQGQQPRREESPSTEGKPPTSGDFRH